MAASSAVFFSCLTALTMRWRKSMESGFMLRSA
jgi:hypothetical protein